MTAHSGLHVTNQYSKWENHPFLNTFYDLLQIPSPPAHEWYMGKQISKLISEIGFESTTAMWQQIMRRRPNGTM